NGGVSLEHDEPARHEPEAAMCSFAQGLSAGAGSYGQGTGGRERIAPGGDCPPGGLSRAVPSPATDPVLPADARPVPSVRGRARARRRLRRRGPPLDVRRAGPARAIPRERLEHRIARHRLLDPPRARSRSAAGRGDRAPGELRPPALTPSFGAPRLPSGDLVA